MKSETKVILRKGGSGSGVTNLLYLPSPPIKITQRHSERLPNGYCFGHHRRQILDESKGIYPILRLGFG